MEREEPENFDALRERVIGLDFTDPDAARATLAAVIDRMQNQLNDGQKLDLADFSLENLELDKTKKKVKELHLKLLAAASKF